MNFCERPGMRWMWVSMAGELKVGRWLRFWKISWKSQDKYGKICKSVLIQFGFCILFQSILSHQTWLPDARRLLLWGYPGWARRGSARWWRWRCAAPKGRVSPRSAASSGVPRCPRIGSLTRPHPAWTRGSCKAKKKKLISEHFMRAVMKEKNQRWDYLGDGCEVPEQVARTNS